MLKKPEKVDKKIINFRLEKDARNRLQLHAEKKNTDASKIIYKIVWDYIEKTSKQE